MNLASLLTGQARRKGVPETPSLQVSLDNVRVAAPCPVSWEQMTGDSRVRHCAECKLNVYNLSEMTRAEAERLIASREGRVCVRLYRRADGTILTRNCPRGLQAITRRISRVAGAALSAAMSLGAAFAQAAQQAPAEAKKEEKAQKSKLTFTVADPAGAVIQGAQFQLTNMDTRITYTGKTHSDGTGQVSGLAPGSYELKVEFTGFKTAVVRPIAIANDKTQPLRITLTLSEALMGVVVLVDPPDHNSSQRQTTFSGDMLKNLPMR